MLPVIVAGVVADPDGRGRVAVVLVIVARRPAAGLPVILQSNDINCNQMIS